MIEFNQIYNIDCEKGLILMDDNSVDLFVTSPPYYNAREYSQWETVEDYIKDMYKILELAYLKQKNHKYFVLNVGDITSNVGTAKWAVRKLPLASIFTIVMEKIGYEFVDDYIWDKGEPQSKRQLGNPSYPFYQYPVNCYEHILVFVKHQLNKEKIPCPDCHKTITRSNSCTGIGIQSWECTNPDCPTKSAHNRGKRFSERSVMMNDYKTEENKIDDKFVKEWRRDIVKINPVIKINSKGENKVGHSAPFPEEIPEMAIRFFSGVNDLVVDLFNGSGTSCYVAKKLKRNYIGFDTNEEYCRIANERLKTVRKEIN